MFITFKNWWNLHARETGKVKFKTGREAADFVRRIANKGGPNQEMINMRNEYLAINKSKADKDARHITG